MTKAEDCHRKQTLKELTFVLPLQKPNLIHVFPNSLTQNRFATMYIYNQCLVVCNMTYVCLINV